MRMFRIFLIALGASLGLAATGLAETGFRVADSYCSTATSKSYMGNEKCQLYGLTTSQLYELNTHTHQKPEPRPAYIGAPRNFSGSEVSTYRIHFGNASSDLTPQSLQNIALLTNILQSPPLQNACLKLVGHSNKIGKSLSNLDLSFQRAIIVKRHIVSIYPQIDSRIAIEGRGDRFPIEGISPKAPENRRVEIFARDCL